MGNSSIHGPFSMAMLNNQKVIQTVLKVAFLCVFSASTGEKNRGCHQCHPVDAPNIRPLNRRIPFGFAHVKCNKIIFQGSKNSL